MKSLGKSRLRDPQCSYRTSFRKDERHQHVHRHHNRNNTHRYRKYSPHRLRQTQSTVSLKSIHNNRVIKSINDCDPIKPHDHQPSPYHAFLKPQTRETRVVYTMINKRDVASRIRKFFCYWTFLRAKNAALLLHFVTSRICRVHQNHVDVFINIYTPDVVRYVKRINYRLFLDLICKLVVDYQDCLLLKREYAPGKHSEWNKRYLYIQFDDDSQMNILLQGGSPSCLVPKEFRFSRRHDNFKYYFSDYEEDIAKKAFTDKLPDKYQFTDILEQNNNVDENAMHNIIDEVHENGDIDGTHDKHQLTDECNDEQSRSVSKKEHNSLRINNDDSSSKTNEHQLTDDSKIL